MVLVWSHCWHTSACAAIPCHTMLYMLYHVLSLSHPHLPNVGTPVLAIQHRFFCSQALLMSASLELLQHSGTSWWQETCWKDLKRVIQPTEFGVPKVGKSSDSKRDARGNMERNQWGRAWGAEWFGARKLEWVGRQNYCDWVKVQNELCQTLKIAVSCSLSQANSIFARLSRGSVSAKASFGRLSHSDGIYAVRFLLYNLQWRKTVHTV